MGILNTTPDSFYENSRTALGGVVQKASQMLLQGADFLDVGGYSTRPGAKSVSQEEELHRVLPAVKMIVKEFPKARVSVDTFRSEVAKRALDEGACMINDISAGAFDKQMWEIVAKASVPYVAMHLQGNFQTMMHETNYDNILKSMLYYFSEKKAKALQMGIRDFIIDPGFGFSKTLEQNYEVLKNLSLFKTLNAPILVGMSRKSMLYKLLQTDAQHALNATSVVNTIALLQGANMLRVHDVKETKECITIINQITDNE